MEWIVVSTSASLLGVLERRVCPGEVGECRPVALDAFRDSSGEGSPSGRLIERPEDLSRAESVISLRSAELIDHDAMMAFHLKMKIRSGEQRRSTLAMQDLHRLLPERLDEAKNGQLDVRSPLDLGEVERRRGSESAAGGADLGAETEELLEDLMEKCAVSLSLEK